MEPCYEQPTGLLTGSVTVVDAEAGRIVVVGCVVYQRYFQTSIIIEHADIMVRVID